ncbi:MAG TPA: DUF883 family protein [Burkholderiales bacterium]|jgi:ElaB/YqjD/DUF883 family membrane-anchored ribosome-binding protein|nr:DUF883 family protein [Burkholderiales bacterium]
MNAPTEKIVTDVKVLVTDIEELLKATASQSGERVHAARARLESALMQARDTVTVQARQAIQATDQYVHQKPWQATGIAAAVGVVIGLLIGGGGRR